MRLLSGNPDVVLKHLCNNIRILRHVWVRLALPLSTEEHFSQSWLKCFSLNEGESIWKLMLHYEASYLAFVKLEVILFMISEKPSNWLTEEEVVPLIVSDVSTYFCRNSASVSWGEGTPPGQWTVGGPPTYLWVARSRGWPEARPWPFCRGPPLTPPLSSPSVSESVPLLWLDQLKQSIKSGQENTWRYCEGLILLMCFVPYILKDKFTSLLVYFFLFDFQIRK